VKRIILAIILAVPVAVAQEHGKEASHGGGGEHPDDSLGALKWLNFGILAALIGWAASKNAGAFFASRSAGIRKAIDEANQLRQESESRAAAIEKRIASLSEEVAGLRNASKKEMEAEAARIREETARMLEKLDGSARQEIASMTKQAQAELKEHAAQLSLDLAEQKVRARLDAATQDKLVSGFLSNLQRGPSSN
jgi:F-type H+-transporting ATPase subunit b